LSWRLLLAQALLLAEACLTGRLCQAVLPTLSPPTILKIGWLFAFCVEIGEIVEAEVTCDMKLVLSSKLF
jgi:hypothetical protein